MRFNLENIENAPVLNKTIYSFFYVMVSVSRAGHEDSKPIYDVAKVQEGCDVPQHKIDAGEGRCGCCHTAGYCALLLGSLGRLYCHHYTRVYTICLSTMRNILM